MKIDWTVTGLVALAAAAGTWLIRETVGEWLRRISSRTGAVGYQYESCGFYAVATSDTGLEQETLYDPRTMFLAEKVLPLRSSGRLYNDSATPIILKDGQVYFEHPDPKQGVIVAPTLSVNGEKRSVIEIPAHGSLPLTVFVNVPRDALEAFAHTIPVLHMRSAAEKEFTFRLAHTQFYGRRAVGWPRRGDRPFFLTKEDPA